MVEFTDDELREVTAIIRYKLRYEASRPARFNSEGKDWQAEKVWILSSALDKLEKMRLER